MSTMRFRMKMQRMEKRMSTTRQMMRTPRHEVKSYLVCGKGDWRGIRAWCGGPQSQQRPHREGSSPRSEYPAGSWERAAHPEGCKNP